MLAPLQSSTYHCRSILSIPVREIDPSLALGFYCRDKADFDDFWHRAKQVRMPLGLCRSRPHFVVVLSDVTNEVASVQLRGSSAFI